MSSPEPTSGAIGLSAAAILLAAPFGVNVESVAIGMCFGVLGLFGRVAFDVQRALENGGKVYLAQAIGWVAAGLLGTPFITVLWLLFLKQAGVQSDFITVIGLLFLGFTGSKGLFWLVNLVFNTFKARLGSAAPEPPKPGE